MKKILSVFLLMISLLLISCKPNTPQSVMVTEINIKGKEKMLVSEKQNLDISILPEDASNKKYSIEVSDETICKANGNELVALKEGTVIITVKALDGSNVKKEYTVTIEEKKSETILVSSIEVSTVNSMFTGEEQEITITVLPENATNKDVEIEVITLDILAVENNKVKALKEGLGKIKFTAKDGSKISKEIEINVEKKVDDSLILSKMESFIKEIGKDVYENLPTEYEDYQVSYELDKNVTAEGVITREELDVETKGKLVFKLDDHKVSKEFSITIVGTYIDILLGKFYDSIPKVINTAQVFSFKFEDYGSSRILVKESDKPEYLSTSGEYNRPFHDEEVTLTLNIRTTTPKTSRFLEAKVLVEGQSIEYKAQKTLEWLFESFPKNSILYYDDPSLPEICSDYDVTIKWTDSKGENLKFANIAQDPILGDTQVLKATMTCRGEEITKTVDYLVWNKRYNSTEEKIEDFIKALYYDNVKVYKYKSAAYYETNWGYLPFYFPGDAEINKEYMLEYTYGRVRTNIKKKSTEYVVIHDTAGGSPTHTAQSFALNQVQANNKADNTYISWHFTVGEDGIYQSLPLDEVAYHAGDGSYEYGDTYFNNTYKAWSIGGGNRNGIGIESCINAGADYNVTLRKLAKLVAELLLQFDLSFDRIKQHNHFSGKDCPGVIRHTGRWEEFKNLVKIEYFGKTQLQDVNFSYKSLTPELLDDTGKVLNKDMKAKTLKYEINVSYKDYTKKVEYTSNLLAYEDWSNK